MGFLPHIIPTSEQAIIFSMINGEWDYGYYEPNTA